MKKKYPASIFAILSWLLLSNSVFGIMWNQKADFVGNRNGAFGFAIGQKGFVGCGILNTPFGITLANDFWEYDKATDQWTQKASMPGIGRISAATFTGFGKGYVTTGYDLSNYLQDTWQYDPLMNSWTVQPDFPGGPRYTCSFFSVSDDGYVGMGKSGGYFSDFYRFDGLSNTWNAVASIPGTPRQSAKGFSIDNLGYVVGGAEETNAYNCKELWCYSPVTDTWMQKSDYPGNGSHGLAAFVMNSHGFVGCGTILSGSNPVFSDFYEYDPVLDNWATAPVFGGGIRAGAVSMSIGNSGFVGLGADVIYPQINYFSDWWTFESTTGIAGEIENTQKVSAYFNNDNLYLQFSLPVEKNTKVNIFDTTGKLVATYIVSYPENSIIIERLNIRSAIYYYSVNEPTGVTFSGKVSPTR